MTTSQLLDSVNAELEKQKSFIQDQIIGKRKIARERRMDRIAQLQEALVLAKATGIVEPKIDEAANQLNMEYMRGTKAIEAEIQLLKNRKNDDSFIDGIRNLQERIASLNAISLGAEKIKPAAIDQLTTIP
ncbi:hypothetical protein Q9L42_003050 [Methylomarinum sp. Ch1-1]|uniref:Uncharacterized protein n=1 Tax=Methylomarinum roseum TaxID=3067653 RepID=A0AAU7NVT2_9GAMM|nr:hypothetical protein [Methylomarinum sp. Ch1-1]MDP4522839.1 hypothetical protein [Methylomarinum sp. Ch1-1]